jgi:hypothetical protein
LYLKLKQTLNGVETMKKSITVLFLLLLAVCGTTAVFAQSESDFEVTVANGTVTITKYKGSGGNVVIPARIQGLPVTTIGKEAFRVRYTSGVPVVRDGYTLPSVIPNHSLTSVTVPNSVTTIGEGAFANCAFTSVTIPNSVITIGDRAFESCQQLTSVTIGNSVTTIGNGAFSRCYRLTGVTIPSSVTTIGSNAFYFCKLTSVIIPNSVTEIGGGAFNCSELTAIRVGSGNTRFAERDGVLFSKDFKTLIRYPVGKNAVSYSIPNGVTMIGYGAFEDHQLTEITIPNSVTTIKGDAFTFSAYVEIVDMDDGYPVLTDMGLIGPGETRSRTTLTSITIGNSVTTIGAWAFLGNKLTSVTIPNSVTEIGRWAFALNPLTNVTIGANVSMNEQAFGFNDGFETFYNITGKNAGVYTFHNGAWSYMAE